MLNLEYTFYKKKNQFQSKNVQNVQLLNKHYFLRKEKTNFLSPLPSFSAEISGGSGRKIEMVQLYSKLTFRGSY